MESINVTTEYPDSKGTHKDPWVDSCTGQPQESHHDVCTTNHLPTRLHRAQLHKYLSQAPLCTGNLLQSIAASQLTETPMLTAKRVYTTWLIWHKSPMMFQASSTNWFNKSQPRKFFLHVTVKATRTFCDTARTHGAVYVLLIWFARYYYQSCFKIKSVLPNTKLLSPHFSIIKSFNDPFMFHSL